MASGAIMETVGVDVSSVPELTLGMDVQYGCTVLVSSRVHPDGSQEVVDVVDVVDVHPETVIEAARDVMRELDRYDAAWGGGGTQHHVPKAPRLTFEEFLTESARVIEEAQRRRE